jgi:VanZ family protein
MELRNFWQEHKLKIRFVLIILTVLWMLLIFSLSSQTANESSKLSGEFINNGLSFLGFNFIETLASNIAVFDRIQFIVRKLAHMFLYTILSILVSLIAVTYDFRQDNKAIFSFAVCFLYAISDEIHQLFIGGRSGRIFDVGVDTIGIVIGIMLVFRIWTKITIDKTI